MVNDLLTILREETETPFKPATPEEQQVRKEARRKELEAKRGKKVDFCPHCGEDLREVGVTANETSWGTATLQWSVEDDTWDMVDSETNDSEFTEYFCGDCGEVIKRGKDFDIYEANEAESPFKPATKQEIAQREKDAPPEPLVPIEIEWRSQLQEIIDGYKDGEAEPLDGDEVDRLVEIIRLKLNFMEGNITQEEYLNSPIAV